MPTPGSSGPGKEGILRTPWVVATAAALLIGAAGGVFLAPQPADAVSKEIIQLQEQVASMLQGQRDLQTTVNQNYATLKTLLEQSLDSVNHLNTAMGGLQKTVQDVQANTGSRVDSLSTQVQGLSDSLDDVKARLGKVSQQLADTQGVLQSVDAKLSGGTPMAGAAGGGTNPSGAAPGTNAAGGGPPPSADVLYTNGLRDFTSGNYDLSRQEFQDYLKYYPNTELTSNARFYLGEIAYAQGQFREAIASYDDVLTNYPKSFKKAVARLKKAYALLELHQKSSAIHELREVIRLNPGTDEERRARGKLRELGVPVPGR